MRAHLALFDPASSTTEGTFWSWRSAQLDVQFLDHLYYDFAKVLRPEDPNSLQLSEIVGGFLCESGWIAAYRFGNGGRDRHGRPGRFVLVVTAVTTDTARDCNLQSLLTCPETEKILRQAAKECPVPPPAKLWVDLPDIPAKRDPGDLATFWNHGRWLCQSQDALQRLTNLLGLLTEHGPWAAEVQVSRKTTHVALRHLQPTLLIAHQSVAFRGTKGIHAYSFPPRRGHTVSWEPRNFKDRLQPWLTVAVLIITHMLAFSAGLVSSRLVLPPAPSSEAVREGSHEGVLRGQPPDKQQTDVKAQESRKPGGSADSTPQAVREGTHAGVVGSQPPAKQQSEARTQESQKSAGTTDSTPQAIREGTHAGVVGSQPPAKQQSEARTQESQKSAGSTDSTPRSEEQASPQSPAGNRATDSSKLSPHPDLPEEKTVDNQM